MNHIEIFDTKNCCGCGACVAVCPNDCIVMPSNPEGFLYPKVDSTNCIECGLCTEVCPWLNQPAIVKRIFPPQVYAAWYLDDQIRRLSSSGGAFSALADTILDKGGVVVGAAFDENMVCHHIMVEDSAGLACMRGSKYVQSEITPELFSQIRCLLLQGRYLLFTGTPCQVAALRNYLGRDYETLFCCDLICHGVPSPGWFQQYISSLKKGNQFITSFEFRYKEVGWKQFRIKKIWSDGSYKIDSLLNDPFAASFLKDFSLRESCYVCKFTTTTRMGDITIADYWKVSTKYPEYDLDDKGTSLLLVNSKKGKDLLTYCQQSLFLGKGNLDHAIEGNPMLIRPAARPPERETFFLDLQKMKIKKFQRKYQLYQKSRKIWRRVLGFIIRNLKLRNAL